MTRRYARTFSVTVAIACFLSGASPVLAKDKSVPQEEYRSLIHECQTFLGAREIDPATAKKLAVRLRAISSVVRPSGQVLPVDTKPESDALDAISGTTPDKKLQQRFAVLEDQLSTVTTVSKKDAHATAEQILAAVEFKTSRPDKAEGKGWDWSFLPRWLRPIGTALEPALRWIGNGFKNLGKWFVKAIDGLFRGIGKFFRWLANRFPQPKGKWNVKNPFATLGNNVLLTLIFLATVAAIVGVYFFSRYLFDLYEIRTGRKKRASGALGGDLDLSDEGITDPLNTARERAAQGDYRSAIRLTYIAALWKLGENGILTLEKNRTNWEYQRALRQKSPALHDDLIPATRLFDRVWYGKQAATQREFETVSAIYDKLPSEPSTPVASGSEEERK